MKTILIPTDFSETSENAIKYALALNEQAKAEIVLLHSFYVPMPTSEALLIIPDQIIFESALDTLEKLKVKFQSLAGGVNIRTQLSEGFPDVEILAAEKKLKPDLVIMGTSGLNPVRRFLLGSNTTAIIEKSECPVITVPAESHFTHINKIVFAANYGEDDFKNVYDLINFARPFNAEIILLHVSAGKHDKAFDFNQLDGFKNQIQTESGYKNLSLKLLEDENVFDGVNNYLNEVKADMFAISMRNRTFIGNIFKPGLTRKMVYHTHVPMIIFHTDV